MCIRDSHNITVTICISVVGPSGDPCLLVLGVGFSERLVADVRLMFFFHSIIFVQEDSDSWWPLQGSSKSLMATSIVGK